MVVFHPKTLLRVDETLVQEFSPTGVQVRRYSERYFWAFLDVVFHFAFLFILFSQNGDKKKIRAIYISFK